MCEGAGALRNPEPTTDVTRFVVATLKDPRFPKQALEAVAGLEGDRDVLVQQYAKAIAKAGTQGSIVVLPLFVHFELVRYAQLGVIVSRNPMLALKLEPDARCLDMIEETLRHAIEVFGTQDPFLQRILRRWWGLDGRSP